MSKKEEQDVPLSVKLLIAGTAACFADFMTFPLDTVKVRMQVSGESRIIFGHNGQGQIQLGLLQTMRKIVKAEGIRGLYGGLYAGLQRQTCFSGIRFGLYETIKTVYTEIAEIQDGFSLNIGIRICAGISTAILAVSLAQPTDVVKVRFQAGNIGKSSIRYNSTLDAYKTIASDEGLRGLWKGTFPNMCRNAIINVGEIVCYDVIKELILNTKLMKDGIQCNLIAGTAAGFCTTIIASPVDVVKTRFMNSQPGEYKSALDTAVRMFIIEGPQAFYKGFIPSFTRLVVWNIVLWVTYDKLKIQAKKYYQTH